MKAIVISVNFADYLAATLPRNVPHFDKVVVVTTPQDKATAKVVDECRNAELLRTDAFFVKDAAFNKGAGIREGLLQIGREGWICLLDADVVLPSEIPKQDLRPGNLYAPLRRMCYHPELWNGSLDDWNDRYPLFPDIVPSGYCLIFHADDRHLEPWPAYPAHWMNGASHREFQDKWHSQQKHRLPFDVLHLGSPAENWYGRQSPPLSLVLPDIHKHNGKEKM